MQGSRLFPRSSKISAVGSYTDDYGNQIPLNLTSANYWGVDLGDPITVDLASPEAQLHPAMVPMVRCPPNLLQHSRCTW
jgi:hypothetical protein